MLIQSERINRRHFLKCAGISFALPLLDSLSPRLLAAKNQSPPMRALFISSPCGIVPDQWYPNGEGRHFELSRCLKPLERHRDSITVFRGLWHSQVPGGGHGGEALLLTGANPHANPAKDWSTTISIDQELAEAVGTDTRFESIQMCGTPSSGFGSPQTVSYSREGVALEAEWRPGHVFDALFGDHRDVEKKRAFHAQQRSILDLLRDDLKTLDRKLDATDRQKLDEYVTSVRGIEKRLERDLEWMDRPKPRAPVEGMPYNPEFKVADAPMHMETMLELIWAGLQTDSSRVFSYVVGNMGGGYWSSLGTPMDKHSISHHRGNKEQIELLAQMDLIQSQKLANFMDRLQQSKEADGSTLLDNTVIFTGSAMQDANAHRNRDLPITLLGGNRVFKQGEVRRYDEGEISNLFTTLLQGFGVEKDSFAASETVYSELLKS